MPDTLSIAILKILDDVKYIDRYAMIDKLLRDLPGFTVKRAGVIWARLVAMDELGMVEWLKGTNTSAGKTAQKSWRISKRGREFLDG